VFVFGRQVYGHVGDCGGRSSTVDPTFLLSAAGADASASVGSSSSRGGSLTPREATFDTGGGGGGGLQRSAEPAVDRPRVCVVAGDVVTTRDWYGFLRNLSLEAGGGYRFLFTYPSAMQV